MIFSSCLFITAVLLGIIFYPAVKKTAGTEDESAFSIAEAIRRSALQCYIIEGSYPADLDYLINSYGLKINREDYYIVYDAFARNQAPAVRVIRK